MSRRTIEVSRLRLTSTLTEAIYRNGQEHILLKFVGGGKENPFNWSVARKAFITLLLCLMTLFIGLQQQHTAVKLMAWWKALGYPLNLDNLGYSASILHAPLLLFSLHLCKSQLLGVLLYSLLCTGFIAISNSSWNILLPNIL
jgi:hypothetical protein